MGQDLPSGPFVSRRTSLRRGRNVPDELRQPLRISFEPIGQLLPLVVSELVERAQNLALGKVRTLDPHPMSLSLLPFHPPPLAGEG